jgi:hypothetical protein
MMIRLIRGGLSPVIRVIRDKLNPHRLRLIMMITGDKRGFKSGNTGDTGQAISSTTKANNDDRGDKRGFSPVNG